MIYEATKEIVKSIPSELYLLGIVGVILGWYPIRELEGLYSQVTGWMRWVIWALDWIVIQLGPCITVYLMQRYRKEGFPATPYWQKVVVVIWAGLSFAGWMRFYDLPTNTL